MSPLDFSEKFQGDTIQLSVPDADNAFFETFKLAYPDTVWIKERPKNKLPQEHKHFKLIKNFAPVPGWGVNSHRQYTPGTVLQSTQFILRGSHVETIQYLGTFNYVLLEDVATGKLIKWDFSKNENKGIIIFSPSIIHHLSLMKGVDLLVEDTDSTLLDAKCQDVAFSIEVRPPSNWIYRLDADFTTSKGKRSSHNWSPMYFLKKDESKIQSIRTNQ